MWFKTTAEDGERGGSSDVRWKMTVPQTSGCNSKHSSVAINILDPVENKPIYCHQVWAIIKTTTIRKQAYQFVHLITTYSLTLTLIQHTFKWMNWAPLQHNSDLFRAANSASPQVISKSLLLRFVYGQPGPLLNPVQPPMHASITIIIII